MGPTFFSQFCIGDYENIGRLFPNWLILLWEYLENHRSYEIGWPFITQFCIGVSYSAYHLDQRKSLKNWFFLFWAKRKARNLNISYLLNQKLYKPS